MEGPPNHPRTFGDEMRGLRESAGLSLQDIVEETKISKQILLKLESGDFRFLPQKVFCRNFVAQYAAAVGADPAQLVDAFEGAWERFLLASGSHPHLVVEEEPLVRTVRWRFWLPVLAAAAILVAAAVVIWRSSGAETHFGPGVRTVEDGQRTRLSAPSRTELRMTPTMVVPPNDISIEAVNVSIVVRVRPEMECWIHFRDRDGVAGGKLLAGGSEERIDLPGPVKLTVGDAGAVSLEVAGRVYNELGRAGQVVHTEASAEGLVVLGPRARDE